MTLARRRFLKLAAPPPLSRPRRMSPRAGRLSDASGALVIVGQAAGSASDITARLIAQWLSEQLGQQFVVEARPGASRQHRDRVRRPRAARRLHAAAGQRAEHHQRRALRQARLRFPARHRAGRRHRPRAAGDGGQSVGSGQDRRRVHRLRQGQSRQDQHGVGRHRRAAARRGRAVQIHGRRRHDARALSRLDAGGDRPDRRARCRSCST